MVAHHISLIALQADTVRLTTPGLPADGMTGLVTIGDSARTALTEMRRLLGVLREDTAAEPDAASPACSSSTNWWTRPGRPARTAARLIVQGRVRPLSPVLELTAYRIVQEALSNSRRHAPGAAHRRRRALRRGRAARAGTGQRTGAARADGSAGHGLTGMRERAAMIGGTVTAGPACPVGVPGRGRPADRRGPAVTVRILVADDQEVVRAAFRRAARHPAGLRGGRRLAADGADRRPALRASTTRT